jgi:hypothetical protein
MAFYSPLRPSTQLICKIRIRLAATRIEATFRSVARVSGSINVLSPHAKKDGGRCATLGRYHSRVSAPALDGKPLRT